MMGQTLDISHESDRRVGWKSKPIMVLLMKNLIRLALIILGLFVGLVFFEALLHLIPEMTFRRMVVYRPQRYDFFQEDRNIGWVHLPNVSYLNSLEGEFEVMVNINSRGVHDVEREYTKPSGTVRVLMLGDSFVEAAQVEMSQNMSSLLQTCLAERLNLPVEVINGGRSAYGPGDELLFLQYEGLKYQPDLILTGFFVGNDFRNVQHEEDDAMTKTFGAYRFELEEGKLTRYWVSWQEPGTGFSLIERLLRRYSRIYFLLQNPDSKLYRYYLQDWQKQLMGRISGRAASEVEEEKPPPLWHAFIYVQDFPDNPAIPEQMRYVWDLLQAIIEETQAQAQTSGARYGVFLIPEIAQVDETAYQAHVGEYSGKWDMTVAAWDTAAPNKAMVEMLSARGIPVLDLLPAFIAHTTGSDEPLYFAKDQHFTPEGHRVTAELICDWVVDNQMIGP
jgi:hypothetical protein